MGLMDVHMDVPVWYRITCFSHRHIREHPVGSEIIQWYVKIKAGIQQPWALIDPW